MVNQALEGDYNSAQHIQNSFDEITKLMFREGNPAGVKAALKLVKVCGEDVRLPLIKMSETGIQEMEVELNKLSN